MAVSTTLARNDYVGEASTATYDFDFQVLSSSDLAIYEDGTLQTVPGQYTVTINTDRTGSVTRVAGNLPDGSTLALVNEAAIAQPVVLTRSNGYRPDVVERALDRVTLQMQGLREEVRHSIRFPRSLDFDGLLPSSRASKVFGTDSSGNFELIDRGEVSEGGGGTGSGSLLDLGRVDVTAAPFNGVFDGFSHPISAEVASDYNEAFADVGAQGAYLFVAGQEQDAVALQCALWTCANTGQGVQLPVGNGRMGGFQLHLEWTATPITGQPARPLIAGIFGASHKSSQLVWDALGAGEVGISLTGTSNPYAVGTHLENFRVYMESTCDATAVCLKVGDCKETFSMFRVFLEGANGMLLKIASSATYAQLCTHFVECKFDANYGAQWTQTAGEYYSVLPDSGGALWDNVLFDSCLFGGLVYCRAILATFFNCQFYSNTRRASVYDGCLYSPIGRITARDCYFEDYRVAIYLTNGISDMRGGLITGCHFSGTVNDVGAPLAKHAIQIVGFGVNKLGSFTITDNHMNFAAYSLGTNGHHQGDSDGVDIKAPGTRIMLANNVNIYDPYAAVTLDVSGCYLHSFDGSDDADTGLGRTTMSRITVIDIARMGGGFVPRKDDGTTAGESWGYSVENDTAGDSYIFGWSSSAYQPTGLVEWIGNSMAFEYIPNGFVKRWGIGTAGTSYMELNATALDLVGKNLTASNVKRGTGSPEGVVTGGVGDMYQRTDGGAGTCLYVKESGTGNTGWVAK